MPFGKTTDTHTEAYWTSHFNGFLKPLIEENPRFQAQRSRALRGDILTQVISDIITSPMLVADLTDKNPNVFWELGVRHSVKHGGTVLVAEEGTKLPFDVAGWSTLFYADEKVKNEQFRRSFKEALTDCLSHRERVDSPVFQAISGRGTLYSRFQAEETSRRLDAIISELTTHVKILGMAVKSAKEKSGSLKKQFPAYQAGLAATELLVSSRYLDADENFYKGFESHYRNMTKINEVLGKWFSAPASIEKFIVENAGKDTLTERLLTQVREIRKKLAETI